MKYWTNSIGTGTFQCCSRRKPQSHYCNMALTFSSIKWGGLTPSIKRFILYVFGGWALLFCILLVFFVLYQPLGGGQSHSFYRDMCVKEKMMIFCFQIWLFLQSDIFQTACMFDHICVSIFLVGIHVLTHPLMRSWVGCRNGQRCCSIKLGILECIDASWCIENISYTILNFHVSILYLDIILEIFQLSPWSCLNLFFDFPRCSEQRNIQISRA